MSEGELRVSSSEAGQIEYEVSAEAQFVHVSVIVMAP
jgi:hypothetical protein